MTTEWCMYPIPERPGSGALKTINQSLYLENMKGVNGLKAIGSELLIGAGKNFIKADQNKTITPIAELPQAIDGIEPVGNGDYLLTSWGGYIYYVSARGQIETLLETYQQKKNTADIGYDAKYPNCLRSYV